MPRWTIGDVEIHRLVDLDFPIPSPTPIASWAVPSFAPSTHDVLIAFTALAIEADGVKIVVDPWLANDGPRTRPGAAAYAERLLSMLTAVGFAPDDVQIVVNTHLDGVGWNTRPADDGPGHAEDDPGSWTLSFPNARYLYPAAEVAAIERGDEIGGHEAYRVLAGLTPIERVEPPLELTPSVSLDPAPGHNAGHVAVRVESGGELAIYPGHLVISPTALSDPDLGDPANPGREVAPVTRRQIFGELADRDGLLLTTLLGGPGGGRVRRDGGAFRIEPDTPGPD